VANSLPLSALVAAIPIFALLIAAGRDAQAGLRWQSAGGAGNGAVVAAGVYRHAIGEAVAPATYGAAFRPFCPSLCGFRRHPAVHRVTLESGKFDLLKDSIGHITERRAFAGAA